MHIKDDFDIGGEGLLIRLILEDETVPGTLFTSRRGQFVCSDHVEHRVREAAASSLHLSQKLLN